jgi:ferredoxin
VKLRIDADMCQGHGRCYSLVPELLQGDDEGFVIQRGTTLDIAEGQQHLARQAVNACPEDAITIED